MKDKILAFLKSKLPQVQGAFLEGIAASYAKTITEESQIETVLVDGVIDALKQSGAMVQSESTRMSTDASKRAIEEYEKKHNIKDGKVVSPNPPNPPTPSTPPEDAPAWAKSLIDSNKSLADKLEKLENEKATQTKAQKASAALQASKVIPQKLHEKWAKRLNPDSETSLEDQVKELETEFNELHTDIVGSTVGSGLPKGGGADGAASETEVDAIVGKM